MGTAKELANVIAFLASAKASFVTGQNIAVDGGVSLHWHESLARQLTPLKDLKVTR
jgi:NAD(P)-dependent dehydrogenase (short-subunit alcohol dehydrogenase family)